MERKVPAQNEPGASDRFAARRRFPRQPHGKLQRRMWKGILEYLAERFAVTARNDEPAVETVSAQRIDGSLARVTPLPLRLNSLGRPRFRRLSDVSAFAIAHAAQ